MSELIALADACEAATGPDFHLDMEIMRAVRRDFNTAPGYTASLDAAMTLVPEGWGYSICPNSSLLTRSAFSAGIMSRAKTPALALCAAALRARAQASHGDK